MAIVTKRVCFDQRTLVWRNAILGKLFDVTTNRKENKATTPETIVVAVGVTSCDADGRTTVTKLSVDFIIRFLLLLPLVVLFRSLPFF